MNKMEEHQNKRTPKWKTTNMEDDQNGDRPKWKMTKMEDDQFQLFVRTQMFTPTPTQTQPQPQPNPNLTQTQPIVEIECGPACFIYSYFQFPFLNIFNCHIFFYSHSIKYRTRPWYFIVLFHQIMLQMISQIYQYLYRMYFVQSFLYFVQSKQISSPNLSSHSSPL